MKLYHGTAERHLDSILKHGLKPRGKSGRTNWKHSIESNPRCVYLTETYGIHFAVNATEGNERLALIEVEPNPFNLLPDEDFLEQASRKSGQFPELEGKSMHYRTRWFRRNADRFQSHAIDSVKGLGTVSHDGPIPPEQISRYALIRPGSPFHLASDPTITLLNHQLCGAYYRQLTKLLFDGEYDPSEIDGQYGERVIKNLAAVDREGAVEVHTVGEKVASDGQAALL